MDTIIGYAFIHLWAIFILVVIGIAAFWRLEARSRIAADPSLKAPLSRIYLGFAFWVSLPFLVMGIGIVTGQVPTIFHYLSFKEGKPFIIAFQGLIFAEDGLFLFWVFFRDGARKLSIHTELMADRPKFQMATRILALALPLIHALALYQGTLMPIEEILGTH